MNMFQFVNIPLYIWQSKWNTKQPLFEKLRTKGTISSFGLEPYNFAQDETCFSDSLIYNLTYIKLVIKETLTFSFHPINNIPILYSYTCTNLKIKSLYYFKYFKIYLNLEIMILSILILTFKNLFKQTILCTIMWIKSHKQH